MEEYDLVVLGGGTGNAVADAAAEAGLDVALVERDRLGGTCLNRGCNPTKRLIHRANVVETVRSAGEFGVDATLDGVDFEGIVDEVVGDVEAEAEAMAAEAREREGLTFYHAEGRFVDERTVEIDTGDGDTDEIRGDRVVFAGGSRPLVPDSIDGTDDVDFLTSAGAIRLAELPERLVIVGGGYIAVELGHFFGQLGSEIVVVGHGDVLLDREDRDVADRLTGVYDDRYELHLGYEATALAADDGSSGEDTGADDRKVVAAESEDGDRIEVEGDEVLVATGRRPNTESWNVEAAGIRTDDRGFVETDEYLETSVEGVYAVGDVAGNYAFKHSGDREAVCAVANAVYDREESVDYPGMAHAVFGSPEVGSLGKTEGELDDGSYDVGTCEYGDVVLGSAMNPDAGFAKVLVGDDGEILGFHVVGPHASTLVHEVSTAVAAGADAERVAETIHVHPALSEVVQGAFRDVRDVTPPGF